MRPPEAPSAKQLTFSSSTVLTATDASKPVMCSIRVAPPLSSDAALGSDTLLASPLGLSSPSGHGDIYKRRPDDTADRRRAAKMLAGSMMSGGASMRRSSTGFEQTHPESAGGKDRQPWWKPKVIYPNDSWYMWFWYFTMSWALANAILDPYDLAFSDPHGWGSEADFWGMMEYLGTLVFFIDIVLKFFLAYEDEESKEMVTDFRAIGKHYTSFMFWMDLLFWFPFVSVILTAWPELAEGPECELEIPHCGLSVGYYVGLLGFLKLGRLYRIFHLFEILDHAMVISQITLMLLRNFFYIMLTCHWFACIFYFIARAEGYGVSNSWIGRSIDRFEGQPQSVVYIYALYLSVASFAGLGDQDFYSNSPAESIAMAIYLLFNVVLGAYILGTVTMLMVKQDERSKKYRDRISNLKEYSSLNQLPSELRENMRAHLELHFQSEQCSDEYVLSLYPSAIRRRVLRHLYLGPLKQCYLFNNMQPKFLDAVLAACRSDLFMPNMHLISEGDIVSDLYIMVEGEVQVMSGGLGSGEQEHLPAHRTSVQFVSAADTKASSVWSLRRAKSRNGSMTDVDANELDLMHMHSMRPMAGASERRSTSECFGEVAFFTESPSTETVWTATVVRVLVVPRAAYNTLATTYPRQVRTMLGHLKSRTEADILSILTSALSMVPESERSIHVRLEGTGCVVDGEFVTTDIPAPLMRELRGFLDREQRFKIDQLDTIKESVQVFCQKQDRARVYAFLEAAFKGEDDQLRALMQQGVSPSCADVDRRTPLIMASQEGHEATVKLLLDAGAEVHVHDVFGTNALIAAIKNGHEEVALMLSEAGASLVLSSRVIMPEIHDCLVEGDLAKLAAFLRGGADVSMTNVDLRTPLHIAAAQGILAAVKMLVEAGADVDAEDRWGNTPLDDATHAQAMPVVQYLTQFVSDDQDADLIRLDSGESLDSRPRSAVRSRPTSARPVSAKSRPTSAVAAARVPSALLAHGSRRRRASGVVAEERDVQHVKLADMKSGSRALFVSTRNVVLGQDEPPRDSPGLLNEMQQYLQEYTPSQRARATTPPQAPKAEAPAADDQLSPTSAFQPPASPSLPSPSAHDRPSRSPPSSSPPLGPQPAAPGPPSEASMSPVPQPSALELPTAPEDGGGGGDGEHGDDEHAEEVAALVALSAAAEAAATAAAATRAAGGESPRAGGLLRMRSAAADGLADAPQRLHSAPLPDPRVPGPSQHSGALAQGAPGQGPSLSRLATSSLAPAPGADPSTAPADKVFIRPPFHVHGRQRELTASPAWDSGEDDGDDDGDEEGGSRSASPLSRTLAQLALTKPARRASTSIVSSQPSRTPLATTLQHYKSENLVVAFAAPSPTPEAGARGAAGPAAPLGGRRVAPTREPARWTDSPLFGDGSDGHDAAAPGTEPPAAHSPPGPT